MSGFFSVIHKAILLLFFYVFLAMPSSVYAVTISATGSDARGVLKIDYNKVKRIWASNYRIKPVTEFQSCLSGTWTSIFSAQGTTFTGTFKPMDIIQIHPDSNDTAERPDIILNIINSCSWTDRLDLQIFHLQTGENLYNGSPADTSISIPPSTTCSVDIPNVELGTLSKGESTSSYINITKSGSGISDVSITGKDMTSDGILYLGGTASGIDIVPSDHAFVSDGKWVSPGEEGSIPISVVIPPTTPAGHYSSALTATLNCN